MSDATPQVCRVRVWPAVLVALALALIGAASVSMAQSMGYDEAMHAELPAARMAVAAELGEGAKFFDALLGCQQYPFGYPLWLALVQSFTGVSELACRASARVLWAIALLGLFLVVREVASALARDRARHAGSSEAVDSRLAWAPWIAMGVGALSPLGLAYSGTLFLEVPFTAAALFATLFWLRRRAPQNTHRERSELLAGALLTLAFFTKFNYGGLLAAGCALDFALEGLSAFRAQKLPAWLRSAARLAFVPAIVCLWWFVLPLPAGGEMAASHRTAFLGFLGGNIHFRAVPWPARVFDWGAGLFVTPRALLLVALAALVGFRFWRAREVRTVAILGIVCIVPVALHPFHADRFLLPGAPFLWALAALGASSLLPRAVMPRAALLAALVLACGVRADLDTQRLMDWGIPSNDARPEIADYRRAALAERISLAPGRRVSTAGLERADSDAALDALALEAGASARIGWLAAVEKLPPGALQVGLLSRGGSPRRLLEDAASSMLFGVDGVDPGWDNERLRAACVPFDVIFSSEPLNAFGSGQWNFLAGYRGRLATELGYEQKDFAKISMHPNLAPVREVQLIALRRKP